MKKKDQDVRKAVAMRYEAEKHQAPKIIAKGSGEVAQRILKAAQEHNVPIQANSDLVQMLSFLDVGQDIPEEAYKAVAEILAFIYSMNKAYQR